MKKTEEGQLFCFCVFIVPGGHFDAFEGDNICSIEIPAANLGGSPLDRDRDRANRSSPGDSCMEGRIPGNIGADRGRIETGVQASKFTDKRGSR